ncbi:MAG: hypothetical protein JSS60_02900 [Verrucomicrobia bacterium]|nr:hypothetical protein [Verrucomicrobiota bacterium]
MGSPTLNVNSGFTQFYQDAGKIEQALSAMKQLKLPQDIDAMQKGLETVYSNLERLAISAELVHTQSKKVNEKGVLVLHGDSEDPMQKVQQLRKETQVLHHEFINRGQYSVLHDKATALMFKSTRKRLAQDIAPLEEMKKEWKEISSGMKGIMASIDKHQVTLSPDVESRLGMLNMQINGTKNCLLELPLFEKETLIELFALLEQPMPSSASEWNARKLEIDSMIQVLKPEIQQRLDFFVFIVSPEPKGGHEWGKKHRFDNPALLKKALGMAIWDSIKLAMREERWSAKQQFKVLNKFCMFAGEKKGEKEVEKWALQNAEEKPVPLCKAIWALTSQKSFQNFFYSAPLNQNSYQPGFTIKGPIFVEKSPLEKVKEMLAVVCSQDAIEASVKREYVKGCLDAIPNEERYKIDEQVFLLSKDPWKGGKFWGRDHAYDDISVLFEAVKIVSAKKITV